MPKKETKKEYLELKDLDWDKLWQDYDRWKKTDPWKITDPQKIPSPWENPYPDDPEEERRRVEEEIQRIRDAIGIKEKKKIVNKKVIDNLQIIDKLCKLFDRILQSGRPSGFYVSDALSDSEFVGYCRGIVSGGGTLTKEQFERLNEIWKKYKNK